MSYGYDEKSGGMAVPGPMVSGGLGVQVGCGGREVGAAGPSVMGTGVGCQWGQGWGGSGDGVGVSIRMGWQWEQVEWQGERDGVLMGSGMGVTRGAGMGC